MLDGLTGQEDETSRVPVRVAPSAATHDASPINVGSVTNFWPWFVLMQISH